VVEALYLKVLLLLMPVLHAVLLLLELLLQMSEHVTVVLQLLVVP
jgi:hypothetical protein